MAATPTAARSALGLAEFVSGLLSIAIVICWCQGRVRSIWLALCASGALEQQVWGMETQQL
jgi:hypothetical protein